MLESNKTLVMPSVAISPQVVTIIDLHTQLCDRARELMKSKNHDYRGGTGDPFANFRGASALGVDPIIGIMMRMMDKMMRVRTFIEKGTLQVKTESVDDAVLDLINYSVLLAGMCKEERAVKP